MKKKMYPQQIPRFSENPSQALDKLICDYAKKNNPIRRRRFQIVMRYVATITILISVALILNRSRNKIVEPESQMQKIVEQVQTSPMNKISEWDAIETDIIELELEMSFTEEQASLICFEG